MMRFLAPLLLLPVATAALAGPPPAPSAARGGDAYRQQCAACHAVAPAALGPDLARVVGRTAGSVPGFRYSGPLKRSALVWTPDRLRAFITDPQSALPGNRMPFSGVTAPVAADIVAYLEAEQKSGG